MQVLSSRRPCSPEACEVDPSACFTRFYGPVNQPGHGYCRCWGSRHRCTHTKNHGHDSVVDPFLEQVQRKRGESPAGACLGAERVWSRKWLRKRQPFPFQIFSCFFFVRSTLGAKLQLLRSYDLCIRQCAETRCHHGRVHPGFAASPLARKVNLDS